MVTRTLLKTIGILSLQGGFEKHIQVIKNIGLIARAVRNAKDLEGCHGLILPGGESTTIAMLILRRGLDCVIQEKIQGGMPVFGTCAGMILLSRSIEGRSEYCFEALNINIERNAYGNQIHSFEAFIDIDSNDGVISSFPAIFIRAPRVLNVSAQTKVLSELDGYPVMVKENTILACSFHPELSNDNRIHKFFVNTFCQDYNP